MEIKIASYQEKGIRLQLIKLKKEIQGFSIEDLYEEIFQIRKNRKILCTFKWETPARQKFEVLIREQLLQTSITFEEKKIYKIIMGNKFYIEEKEITKKEYQDIVYNNIHNIGKPIKVNYTNDKRFIIMKEVTYEEYKKI